MSSVVVVGTQWGDEGKGKITDFRPCACHLAISHSIRPITRRSKRRQQNWNNE